MPAPDAWSPQAFNPHALSDGELAALALGGRQAAYSALLQRHRDRVFRIARASCGDEEAALDITQQSFISAFAALGRYDHARPFAHWIARIALNKCRDRARRQKLRTLFSFAMPEDQGAGIPDPAVRADDALADRQELARAMACIARLPASQREVLVLRGVEGMSEAEVAAVLGITAKAVETRLYRARRALAEMLEK
ncbi:RNA polymerase sigma factor [Novosphingobium sp. KACC 22771]|uniref:RNA polymerase sigma factor n=1 Tax=Novosphingobium sp. KACC 22771 TaxID=3025670 RepID=UPI0023671156|nr:sigma-70 family RNA polymerase sigma factor [Novosphingobium sp. KACC 22771]WDF71504.1 sigma-70 family RNA polymerase sigma factor [Novosphingobium sp. KACC 22771]